MAGHYWQPTLSLKVENHHKLHTQMWNETSEPRVLFSFLREHISWTADDSGEESENKCTSMSMAAFQNHFDESTAQTCISVTKLAERPRTETNSGQ